MPDKPTFDIGKLVEALTKHGPDITKILDKHGPAAAEELEKVNKRFEEVNERIKQSPGYRFAKFLGIR